MKSKIPVWDDPGRCSSCKHCAIDMKEDPYCVHPNIKIYHRYGVNLPKAVSEFCGVDLKLREPKEEAT